LEFGNRVRDLSGRK